MKKTNLQQLSLMAIMTALTLVLGLFVKLPTPTGVTTLLDVGIYFTTFYFGGRQAFVVGGLSAFLFDLISGYPQWMLISLVAHGGQGYLAGFSGKSRFLMLVLATLFMVTVYFLSSSIMYGVGTALAEVLTNTMQNLVGMLGAYLLVKGLKHLR
ncbi:ECF transporter S component [Streptococcus ictaluri]|uniref:ECF transporter S component n=1 Tax=Streptococcus ictaluri 707-05 TaxID=764299 RepID=G5K564_9STRE|nr:ECF transporter S component [Streptococcus ictaluri]EHI68789.1 hypothetical protein STRIC_1957 [Streptococcus ictaluri 707-05]